MKILYSKRRDFVTLLSAILWGISAGYEILNDEIKTFEYLALFFSFCYLLYFLFDKKEYYLTIKNGVLKKGKFLGKKIKLSEIERITEKENTIVLKNNKSKLIIKTKSIDAESLLKLKSELKKLNVEWN